MKYKLLILLFLPCLMMAEPRTWDVGLGYSGTCVNTAIFRNSAVCTHNNTQYVAYYDAEGYVVLAQRNLNDTTFTCQRTQYRGKVTDGHNIISIGVDGKGYIHVAFDHHGNRLHYCRSTAPGALTLGEMQTMIDAASEKDVTYPEFYSLASGNLLFAYRSGRSGKGNLVLNRYDVETATWHRVQDILIDGEGQRNAYWQLCTDKDGGIHLSWVWRETPDVATNHDLCYARSNDEGRTWQTSSGTLYSLPITMQNAEVACKIPQRSELINQTSMATDDKGNPYIATYWRNEGDSVPQYRVVWHDKKQWHVSQVSHRITPFSLSGGGTKMIPIARPRMVIKGKEAWYLFRDSERNYKASLYHTKNIRKGKWQVEDITPYPVNAWEPCIDNDLWREQHRLHIFLQDTYQGDGERVVKSKPTMVRISEITY